MAVIVGDFPKRDQLSLTFKSQLLYLDDQVCLMRITITMDGRLVSTQHLTVDLDKHTTH